MDKNYFNDNYKLVYSDTIDDLQTTFCGTAFAILYFTYHLMKSNRQQCKNHQHLNCRNTNLDRRLWKGTCPHPTATYTICLSLLWVLFDRTSLAKIEFYL